MFSPKPIRQLILSALLSVGAVLVVGWMSGGGVETMAGETVGRAGAVVPLLTEEQRRLAGFFNKTPFKPEEGTSVFYTDFFRPAPVPPPPPPPPRPVPPPPQVTLVFQGISQFGEERRAFFVVNGVSRSFLAGEEVVAPWVVARFERTGAVLVGKEGVEREVGFNQEVKLVVDAEVRP